MSESSGAEPSGPSETTGASASGEPAKRPIDLQALAERLYRLLIQEARVERERLGRRRSW